MKLKIVVRSFIAAGVIAAGIAGYGKLGLLTMYGAAAAGIAPPAAVVAANSAANAMLPDFSGLVSQNGPAVVNISVTGGVEKTAGVPATPNVDPHDPLYQFFRQFGVPAPQGQSPTYGVGSGFIVGSDGAILTNAHVVDGASNVTVKLTDKREFKAKVVGIDKPTDIAVLKIDAKDLPTVKLDAADDVKVGEWVVAIGSPYGFDNSVTAGIVSAKSRTMPGESYVPFIQTDVAVNPGNSGGPLFNMKGEVVGINSQIYTRTGGYEGLSFAIPINVALHVKDQLLEHGSVTRGQLGVMIQDVNQALAESFGLKKPAGALVTSVGKDSPAAKAGLMPGDIILRYNGQEIADSGQMPALVANTAPESVAKLDVMRNGEERHLTVTVGAAKGAKVASAAVAAQNHGRLGVVVRTLTAEERQQAGNTDGVIVQDATGPAAQAGVQPGDVILSLNATAVKSPEQLQQLIAKSSKHVALLVQRGDAKIFLPVDLG